MIAITCSVIATITSVVPEFSVTLEPGTSVPPAYLNISRLHADTVHVPSLSMKGWRRRRSITDLGRLASASRRAVRGARMLDEL